MRIIITVVGVGERRTGKTKKGKDYDVTPVSFTYEDANYSGVRASDSVVTPVVMKDIPTGCLTVGECYEVIGHYFNGNVQIDAFV